ncbi:MAG: acetylxylan esterase [Gemmatimonadota bacterium]|nr:acetylxylan esterase [Gemmatimonadota bacterium]
MRALIIFFLLFTGIGLLGGSELTAGEKRGLTVKPDREDHIYALGDTTCFRIKVMGAGMGKMAPVVCYRLSEDGERTLADGVLEFKGNEAVLSGALEVPGFLRLELTWISGADTLKRVCGCAFDPTAIRPTNSLPDNFDRFWRQGKAELARIPIDAQLSEVEVQDIPGARRYHVSLANIEGSRIYGWLTVPEGEGPFPSVVVFPGGGVIRKGWRPAYTEAGLLTLAIEVHGIPMDAEDEVYEKLKWGALAGYTQLGKDDPYRYYYRRVILGGIRAADYLCSRADVDTCRIAFAGVSQGGGLSLLAGALDKRVGAIAAAVPYLCDHTGPLFGRPAPLCNLLADGEFERVLRTVGYYDAALSAGLIEVPTLVGVGFIDPICPPTTVLAAYNNLKGPREIRMYPEFAHGKPPGWLKYAGRWLVERLEEKVNKR